MNADTSRPLPTMILMDPLRLKEELRDPAIVSLLDAGYTFGTFLILAPDKPEEGAMRLALVLLPPLRTVSHPPALLEIRDSMATLEGLAPRVLARLTALVIAAWVGIAILFGTSILNAFGGG